MKRLLNRLVNAQAKYASVVDGVEADIAGKIEFDFNVVFHESDGWCVLNPDLHDVAPFEACMEVIRKAGVLSLEDFKKIRI